MRQRRHVFHRSLAVVVIVVVKHDVGLVDVRLEISGRAAVWTHERGSGGASDTVQHRADALVVPGVGAGRNEEGLAGLFSVTWSHTSAGAVHETADDPEGWDLRTYGNGVETDCALCAVFGFGVAGGLDLGERFEATVCRFATENVALAML